MRRASLKFVLVLSLGWLSFTQGYARGHQLNFNLGMDFPDTGEERESSAMLAKFAFSSNPSLFRLVGSFTAAVGSGFKQGEFALGPYIYPYGDSAKPRFQPFIYAEGVVGFGAFDETSRLDAGYEAGAGVDWRWTKTGGISLSVGMHSATETALRLWLGFYTRI